MRIKSSKDFTTALLFIAIGLGIFIYGLGMPIKVLPWN